MKKVMNRFVLVLFLIIALSILFVPSAHAAQRGHRPLHPHKAIPQATGGGCSSLRNSPYRDISGSACVSYSYPNVLPDAYVSFSLLNSHGGLSECFMEILLYNNSSGSAVLVADRYYNCTNDAKANRRNVHYGPFSYNTTSGEYNDQVQVDLNYNDGFSSSLFSYFSPLLFV